MPRNSTPVASQSAATVPPQMRTTMNHGLVIEVVMGKNSTRCIPFQGNQLRRPWEVREKPCIATIAREVKATSTSQNCPSTSWILATLRLCKWCDLVIYHKLDNLHVWMTCRPARQVSLLLPSLILISNIQVQMVFYCTDLCRWNSRKHGTFSPSRQVGTAETPTRRADSCGMSCFWPNTFLAFGLGYEVCVGKVLFLCLVADTWWYTHDDTQCRCSPDNWHSYYQFLRTYRIFQHPRLIGQNNVPSWHGVFWPLIFLQHCPISAFGLQRGERDRWSVQSVLRRDVASRVREARELSGDEDPFSQPLFPSHFIDPKAPWVTLGPCRPCRLFFPFLMLKLPISAPHFEIVSLNPGIRWIGVTRAWVAGA